MKLVVILAPARWSLFNFDDSLTEHLFTMSPIISQVTGLNGQSGHNFAKETLFSSLIVVIKASFY